MVGGGNGGKGVMVAQLLPCMSITSTCSTIAPDMIKLTLRTIQLDLYIPPLEGITRRK